jgi:hypothetical protein
MMRSWLVEQGCITVTERRHLHPPQSLIEGHPHVTGPSGQCGLDGLMHRRTGWSHIEEADPDGETLSDPCTSIPDTGGVGHCGIAVEGGHRDGHGVQHLSDLALPPVAVRQPTVARHGACPLPFGVEDRRGVNLDKDLVTVAVPSCCLVRGYLTALAEFCNHRGQSVLALRWDQAPHISADQLGPGPTQQQLSGPVPLCEPLIGIDGGESSRGMVHHRLESVVALTVVTSGLTAEDGNAP